MRSMKAYIITTLALAAALFTSAKAQDFYNGCPGPRGVQIDNYLQHNQQGYSGTVIPKAFLGNMSSELPDLLLAAPVGMDKEGAHLKGVNVGYIANEMGKYGMSGILATGVFADANGDYTVVSPQGYFTMEKGPATLDLEGALNMHLRDGQVDARGAATLAMGNDRFRAGGSVIYADGQRPTYQGLVRYVFFANHQAWIEAYANSKEQVGMRLAANF